MTDGVPAYCCERCNGRGYFTLPNGRLDHWCPDCEGRMHFNGQLLLTEFLIQQQLSRMVGLYDSNWMRTMTPRTQWDDDLERFLNASLGVSYTSGQTSAEWTSGREEDQQES